MKNLLYIFSLLFVSLTAFGQKTHIVTLDSDQINIENRRFYISEVEDNRALKSSIGVITTGIFNKKVLAIFNKPLDITLKEYLDRSLPDRGNMTPIKLVVKKLEISGSSSGIAYAELSVEFYHQNTFLFSTYEQTQSNNKQHSDNIKIVLKQAITTFNSTYWDSKINRNDPKNLNPDYIAREENEQKPSKNKGGYSTHTMDIDSKRPSENRNVTAIGYQIGGWALIGVEYEYRVHDYFGLNAGVGYSGWTAGLKIHTNDDKSSPFFNLSFKDGGFGLINTVGAEYGGRLVFIQKKDIALHTQVGIARLTYIDEGFEYDLFNGAEAPDWWFTLGIGISW